MGVTVRYGEAIALVEELFREHSSHLHAAVAGWQWAVSWGEVMASIHAQKHLAVLYREVDLPMPWDAPAEQVTPEERAALEARLSSMSAIRDD